MIARVLVDDVPRAAVESAKTSKGDSIRSNRATISNCMPNDISTPHGKTVIAQVAVYVFKLRKAGGGPRG